MRSASDQRDDLARHWFDNFAVELDPSTTNELSARIHADILLAVPELATDADISRDAYLTVHAGIESFAQSVGQEPWHRPAVPPAIVAFARTLAQRGAELSTLLKAYRYGQSALWRYVMVVCEREVNDPEVRTRVLMIAHGRLTRWIEAIIESQVELYQEERERWLRGALAQRAGTIHALLRGEDIDVDKASRILAYDLRRQHTALALWASDDAGAAHSRLDALASELAAALGAARALTFPSAEHGLWAWIGTDAAPDPTALPTLLQRCVGQGLRVATGGPASGPSGFRCAHREAVEAQRIAVTGRRRDVLTRYGDVELACLLSKDHVGMEALVRRELGALAAADPVTRRLRETVRVFLACGSNARVAAEQLGTHKNTVFYRLRQAEELLGTSIAERRLHLELALMLADTLGDETLMPTA